MVQNTDENQVKNGATAGSEVADKTWALRIYGCARRRRIVCNPAQQRFKTVCEATIDGVAPIPSPPRIHLSAKSGLSAGHPVEKLLLV